MTEWLELKQDIRYTETGVIIKNTNKYKGTQYSLKDFIEKQISDPTSQLYKRPDGLKRLGRI